MCPSGAQVADGFDACGFCGVDVAVVAVVEDAAYWPESRKAHAHASAVGGGVEGVVPRAGREVEADGFEGYALQLGREASAAGCEGCGGN